MQPDEPMMPHPDAERSDSRDNHPQPPSDESAAGPGPESAPGPELEVDQRALEMALLACQMGDERKAEEIRLLDLRGKTVIADYFVVMTGFNRRQIQSIAWEYDREMKQRGIRKLGVEGYDTGWWVLIDYGSVVVHIFHADARHYYDLDMLWGDVAELNWRGELAALGHPPLEQAEVAGAGEPGEGEELSEPAPGPEGAEYEPGTPPERGPGIEPDELERLQTIAGIDAAAAEGEEEDGGDAEESQDAEFDLGRPSWREESNDGEERG